MPFVFQRSNSWDKACYLKIQWCFAHFPSLLKYISGVTSLQEHIEQASYCIGKERFIGLCMYGSWARVTSVPFATGIAVQLSNQHKLSPSHCNTTQGLFHSSTLFFCLQDGRRKESVFPIHLFSSTCVPGKYSAMFVEEGNIVLATCIGI